MEIIKYILIIGFLLAGLAKVFRAKPMVEQFKEFGLPSFMVVVVGALEVLGSVGIFAMPSLRVYAVAGLIILMIGAVFNHVKFKHNFQTVAPALILGILSSVYLYSLMS